MATEPISPGTARTAVWDDECTAFYLLDRSDLSVVQQLLPPRARSRAHAHDRSRQFFYVLRGEATMMLGPQTLSIPAGSGLEVPPRVRHQLRNDGDEDLEVMVVSSPRVAGQPQGRSRPARSDTRGLVVGAYVRRTRPGDLEQVARIEAASDTSQWLGQGGLEWHEQVLADTDKEHWVLVDRLDRVVAFGILAGLGGPDGAVELRRTVVAREGRGQGLGRQLLRHLLEQALARPQVSRVWLDVGADNVRARSLYRSFGFQEKPPPPDVTLLDDGLYMAWSARRH
jgi:mannose-6-phosphate isomerase-like protein (cupin superfamily)/GNAT superfamily N-acetyltransferase